MTYKQFLGAIRASEMIYFWGGGMGMFRWGGEVGVGGKNSSIQWLRGNRQLNLGKLKCCRKNDNDKCVQIKLSWVSMPTAHSTTHRCGHRGKRGVPVPATSSECIWKHCRRARGIVISFSSHPAFMMIVIWKLAVLNQLHKMCWFN